MSSGDYEPGVFSEIAAVLGLLDHYETSQGRFAGVRVDFGDQGLYFDPAAGENWWEYYFEPIAIGTAENAVRRQIGMAQHVDFARIVEQQMSRTRGSELVGRYIQVKSHIKRKVNSFVDDNFAGNFIVGIHYRGTDIVEEAPRVPYDDVYAEIRGAIEKIETDRYKLFLATDEQAFVDYMLIQFPQKLTFWETVRSVDGTPIWVGNENNYKKGEDAVIDCLLLSRCNLLIRTTSNLGLCSTLFNPDIREIFLCRQFADMNGEKPKN